MLATIVTQSNAQIAEPVNVLDWQALSHHSHLTKGQLVADKRIKVYDRLAFIDTELSVYLYCRESGALLHAMPVKDLYRVLIFPDSTATTFNFKRVKPDFLRQEGIDVESLQNFLSQNQDDVSMGGGMSGNAAADSTRTAFSLDIRVTAKKNPNSVSTAKSQR